MLPVQSLHVSWCRVYTIDIDVQLVQARARPGIAVQYLTSSSCSIEYAWVTFLTFRSRAGYTTCKVTAYSRDVLKSWDTWR